MPALDNAPTMAHSLPTDRLGEASMFLVHKLRRRGRASAPWVLRWRDPPGSRHRKEKTIGAMSERLAERHRELWQAELNGLVDREDLPALWSELKADYLTAIEADLALASVRSVRHILASFEAAVHPHKLAAVDAPMIEAFRVAPSRNGHRLL